MIDNLFRWQTAICSNLASPYGLPVLTALPTPADVNVFSYEVGAIKPEPSIYQHVIDRLDTQAAEVLFVGDTLAADVEGPRAFGFRAIEVSKLEKAVATA